MFRANNITAYYLILQLFGLISAIIPNDIIKIDHSLYWIFLYHLAAVFIFMMGFLLPAIKLQRGNYQYKLKVSRPFMLFALGISFFGVVVSFMQLTSFFSLSEYVNLFLSNDPHVRDVRGLGAHSEDNGIGGILKMFAYAPLGVYLVTVAWQHFYAPNQPLTYTDIINKKRLKIIFVLSLILCLIKAFIFLDRLTLGAIVLANFYIFINKDKSKKEYLIYSALFIVIIFIANILSANRLEGYNIFDFLVLYFKLGLVNFDAMVNTLQGHTYGFSTFLSPSILILKFFGVHLNFNTKYDFVWNDAQYMNSYLHQDFGYYSLIVYFLLGWFMKNADYFKNKGNRYYVSISFILLFGLATFWVVPITSAIEFWLMLVVAFISCKCCLKKVLIV